MSLIEDLGARLAASSADLPVGEVVAALERLRAASGLLAWVRQASSRQIGVPELTGAIEHLEHAGRALQVTQDAVAEYLAAIGLGFDSGRPPESGWRAALDRPEPQQAGAGQPAPAADPVPLNRWWAERVAQLTDGDVDNDPGRGADGDVELLRRVARHTRAGNRSALRHELMAAPPPIGLSLAALSPPVLYRLAGDLLGHRPRGDDLQVLARATTDRVRELLPGLPPTIVDGQLARVCRVPPADTAEPPHPADPAVAGAVLVGVLLHRLDRDPGSLDPHAPEPLPTADGDHA